MGYLLYLNRSGECWSCCNWMDSGYNSWFSDNHYYRCYRLCYWRFTFVAIEKVSKILVRNYQIFPCTVFLGIFKFQGRALKALESGLRSSFDIRCRKNRIFPRIAFLEMIPKVEPQETLPLTT